MTYYIILRGPLGCGKSTIAKLLAKEINAKKIEIDRVLDENNLTEDREEGFISQKSFLKANERIVPQAVKYLENGMNVIFEGNFYWKSQIEDLIKKLNYPHHTFTLQATLKTCIERDSNREKKHGIDATTVVYKKSSEFEYGTIINTEYNQPIEIIDKIKSILKADS
jgi:shikimate kinase